MSYTMSGRIFSPQKMAHRMVPRAELHVDVLVVEVVVPPFLHQLRGVQARHLCCESKRPLDTPNPTSV